MNKLAVLASVVSTAVLLTACGGGGDDNNNGGASNASQGSNSNQGTPPSGNSGSTAPTTNPQPAAFSCPTSYKKLSITKSAVPNATLSLVTDDNLAKVSVKMPQYAIGDVTICLGKPTPTPAGVSADYVYEILTDGDYAYLLNPQISMNFTTPTVLTTVPVIELAIQQPDSVKYIVAQGNTGTINGNNVSVTSAALSHGLFVVRLPH